MSPEELLNLSLQSEVEIEAHTKIEPKSMLSFNFKGLNPLKVTSVPLYIALHFKQLNYCTIRTPYYLNKEFLTKLIEKEKNETSFVEIPEFLFEHAHYFKNNEIESCICELKVIRRNKMWKGMSKLDGKAIYITGISRWEFNEYKEYILKVLKFGNSLELE